MRYNLVLLMTCSTHATHQRTDFRNSFIEHIFIEHLLCTPDTVPGTGDTEDKTDKNPCPYRTPRAYILVKSRYEN